MIEAYPLQWPLGYPRTSGAFRENGKFKTSFSEARDAIINEIRRFGGSYPTISSNVPLLFNGKADGNKKGVSDPGVAVYFTFNKEQVVFACDKFYTVDDNLQAIRRTIDAFRSLERWGVSELMKRAFSGLKALQEAKDTTSWFAVLGVPPTATKEEIKSAYRNLSSIHHPDAGGSNDKFISLTQAYQTGLKQVQ